LFTKVYEFFIIRNISKKNFINFILKQIISVTFVKNIFMQKDIIIIGGGIGGLMTACLLCKEGYRPTIIEQHDRIGGGLHCFKRKGIYFESGIHYISGFEDTGVLKKIFSYLGLFDKIKIKPLDNDCFDLLHIGSENLKVKMGIGKDNFIQLLSEQFPHEAHAIQRYVNAIYEICNSIPLLNLRIDSTDWYTNEEFLISVNSFIKKFIKDEQLQHVLAWNNTLYGGSKDNSPIYIHAIITKFYIEGAARFIGGGQHVADAMADMIQSHGGKIILNTEITKIEIENKKITKIIAKDNREFYADNYIANIHPALLMDLIDPNKIQKAYRTRLQNLEISYSAFILYVHFKPNTFPYLNYNYFYYKNRDLIWDAINYNLDDYPPGFVLMTLPTSENEQYAERGIITCIMRYDDFSQWENTYIEKRGDNYKVFKNQIETKLLNLVNEVFPNFNDSIENVYSASPLSIRDYLRTKNGGLYGFQKNCDNLIKTRIFPHTKITNLFLTGQNINLHGILGVPLNAILTTSVLIGDMNYLINKINQHP